MYLTFDQHFLFYKTRHTTKKTDHDRYGGVLHDGGGYDRDRADLIEEEEEAHHITGILNF